MKAVAIAGPEDVLAAARYEEVADLLLFDAKPPRRPDALPGGNGLAFDWRLIAGRSWRRPMDALGRVDCRAVAGGGAHFRRRARSMSPRASRAVPARRTPTRSARFSPSPARLSDRENFPRASCTWMRGCRHRTLFAAVRTTRGHFGIYGGRFVAETLMPLVLAVEAAYDDGQGRSRLSRPSWTITSTIMSAGRARSISPSG